MSGFSLLLDLPNDILPIVGRSLSPKDVCNLSFCCKSLNALMESDKIWVNQCEMVGVVSPKDLVEWRKAVKSYKVLCRFLTSVQPLIGLWVRNNPRGQNPNLGSVVYVIPGFVSVVGCRIFPQNVGPVQWAPVFEVIGDYDGSSIVILHGSHNYIYPGSVKYVEKNCNVLLLQVEAKRSKSSHSESFDYLSDEESGLRIDGHVSTSQNVLALPFNKLSTRDQEKLLNIVTSKVRIENPENDFSPLFPCLQRRMILLSEHRSLLIRMHKLSGKRINWLASSSSSSRNMDADLCKFLTLGDEIGLILHASAMKLSSTRAWPDMRDIQFALYKMPVSVPTARQKYAGLWGGTFGWPPEIYDQEKALLFLALSYCEESRLVATKILNGAEHPNGSVMFTVNVNKPSVQPFPWNVSVKESFSGEPGSLFELNDGTLVFIRVASVLVLQRLNLEDLLKRGKRVTTHSPASNFSNFSYLD